jgi:acetaldehyde dehydrogenase
VESVNEIVREVQALRTRIFPPAYRPSWDGNKVTVIIQVEGAGDFLPKYSGNLDIINAAAVAAAEKVRRPNSQGGAIK